MRPIIVLRNRYAVPGVAALLLAVLGAGPLEALFVSRSVLLAARFLDPLLRLALFAWIFALANAVWSRWLQGRPQFLVLPRARKTRPERPVAEEARKRAAGADTPGQG